MLNADGVSNVRQPVDSGQTGFGGSPGQGFEAVAGFVWFRVEGLVRFAPLGDVWEGGDGFVVGEERAGGGFGFEEEAFALSV